MAVPLQSEKVEVLIAPATQTLATNASNYGYLDTLGWDQASILITQGTGASDSAAFKVCAVTEGTNSTAATAIVALTGGDATSAAIGWAWGNYSSSEPNVHKLDIDLRKRERYLRLQANVGAAGIVVAHAILSRGKVMPGTDDGDVQVQVIA